MDKEKYEILKILVNAQNIKLHVVTEDYNITSDFDYNFRNKIYETFDYTQIKETLKEQCKENTLYLLTDRFYVNYVIMFSTVPQSEAIGAKASCFIAGPFFNTKNRPDTKKVLEQNELEQFHYELLNNYYNSLVVNENVDVLIQTFLSNFSSGYNSEIKDISLSLNEDVNRVEYYVDLKTHEEVESIEARYKLEKQMLDEIQVGNKTNALKVLKKLTALNNAFEVDDEHIKGYLMTLNVLFRQAVHNARVHAVHIDSLSVDFKNRINSCHDQKEFKKIPADMIAAYCQTVVDHSMGNYSPLIENVVNYIEFNFTENLTLKKIAGEFFVNASYLSARFKKEVAMTITDYVNLKKIDRASYLLNNTKMQIQQISGSVGIMDENYFSRLFKKYKNVTPNEYRKSRIKL